MTSLFDGPIPDPLGRSLHWQADGRPYVLSNSGKRLSIAYPNKYALFVSGLAGFHEMTEETLRRRVNIYFGENLSMHALYHYLSVEAGDILFPREERLAKVMGIQINRQDLVITDVHRLPATN